MKILFCDNSLKELMNFRGDVIRHFSQKGDELILVAPKNTDESILDFPHTFYGSNLHRSGMNPISDLCYFFNLFKIYKREKPDLIFHYTIKPNIYGSIVAKLLSIPSVAMIAGLGYAFNHQGFKTKIARALYRFSMRYPRKIFVLNEENLALLVNHKIIDPNKAVLLNGGEGVNLEKYK